MKKSGEIMKIDGIEYSSKNPIIIAELGTSHNGDISKAMEMAKTAAECGANCVKFQIVYADEILHPNTGEVPLPGGKIRLYDRFKSLEMPKDFYIEVKKYVESLGLLFLCTPFGLKSASILKEIQPKLVKIASPELNYTSLLEEISGWQLSGASVPVLLSSGVSTLGDIEKAVEILGKGSNLCLLHCVTAYPAPESDYNFRVIENLASIFEISVGVSDHSADPQLIPALAVSLGACVVEKHFCLSRNDPGLDDPIALEPSDFSKMVKAIESSIKEGPQETISFYKREKGDEFIENILGNGVKKLAPSEKANYRLTNRSIHALREIQKGEILKKGDFAVLRTEKILRPGLEPFWEKLIEGRVTKDLIPDGEGIRFEDI